jgi:hypothetical protein
MERCPSCGQLSRAGAKFCTICGAKFTSEESVEASSPDTNALDGAASNGESASWPAAPLTGEPASSSGWSAATPENNGPAADEAEANEELTSVWSTGSSDTWPSSTPSDITNPVANDVPDTTPELNADEIDFDLELTDDDVTIENARDRATSLIDELRETIASIGRDEAPDLSGVISDLEVAVTPPGAIGAEELSALREALLAARERPRDIDTIVDLTSRIDAMVALIIAYDRAIAAIERSLEALRRT